MRHGLLRGARSPFSSIFVILVTLALILFSAPASAEFYLGGAIGGNFPLDLSDVQFSAVGGSASSTDIKLEDSLAYGAKAGYFFPFFKWVGVEAEAYTSNPNIAAQNIDIMGLPISLNGADLQVVTGAFNLVARYPGERFEPYLGAGPAVIYSKISNAGESFSTVVPGLNVVAGTRFFLFDWLALFTEYKFNYAKFDYDDNSISLKGTYRANHVHGGISIHFK
jgi:opacity protein-like surface antigen